MKKIYRNKLLLSVIAACMGAVFVSVGNNTFATTSTLSLSVNDIVSLNLVSGDNGVLSGSTSTTNTIISVNTTNATGYTLSIAASTGTANTPAPLNNVDTNCTTNCTIPSITTATSTSDASSLTTGTWGYLPSKFNSTNNTVYRPAPTVEGDILDITSTANASSNSSDNNNYNIAIGAKLDYTNTTPGTYSSTFIITAVANATPYSITYNANAGSDTVTNMPANITNGSTYAETVQLSSNTPVRDDYNFLGWCTVQTTDGQACNDVSGTSYAPNANWTIDRTSNTDALTLYAVWRLKSYTVTVNFAGSGVSSVSFINATYGNAASVTASGGTTSLKYGVPYTVAMEPTSNSYALDTWATTANGTLGSTTDNPTTYTVTGISTLTVTGKERLVTIASGSNMQDVSSKTDGGCPSTLTEGQAYTLTDARDGKSYRVARLADGNCWMLDNLALDLTALTQAQLYGTGDNAGKMTNASNEALGYLKGATTGTATDKWAMAAVKKTWTSDYSYSQPWIAVDSTTSGGCNSAYCVNGGAAGSPWSYDSVTSKTINGKTSIAQGKIGVYYNYCAASAGSYCWGSTGTSSSGSPSSDPVSGSIRDITDDICPYKWRLPTGGSSGEFRNLYNQYSDGSPDQATAFQTALSTPLSGNFSSGKANNQGNSGLFWSSTWELYNMMYSLYVYSNNLNSSNYNYRYVGNSVRCILAE